MGYETTLIFVESYDKKFVDYQKILATAELCNVNSDNFGDLLSSKDKFGTHTSLSKPKLNARDKKTLKQVEEYQELANKIEDLESQPYDSDPFLDEDDQKEWKKELSRLKDRIWKLSNQLAKKLPFIYHGAEGGENREAFTDNYGSPLMIAELGEVRQAIARDQAKMVHTKEFEEWYGYRRFNMALALIDHFLDTEQWDNVKVILWGH